MRIDILAIGSRGDVQPYVALGLGLGAAGHRVRMVTLGGFEDLVRSSGLERLTIGASPQDIANTSAGRDWVRRRSTATGFLRGFVRVADALIEEGMANYWQAARDAEALIVSPMGLLIGDHIAERLHVPLIRAQLAPPVVPTRYSWNGRRSLGTAMQGGLGASIDAAFRFLIWAKLRRTTNVTRRKILDLPPLPWRAPFLAKARKPLLLLGAYSPAVAPRIPDWPDWIQITGYWFLNDPPGWSPQPELADFLASGPPPVFIGFGSVPFPRPGEATELVLRAVKQAGHRAILVAGGSGLATGELSPDVLSVDSVPHRWLFSRVCSAVHHGGAGVTGAALRAGLPSVVVPVFADQPFWGKRVFQLGAGPPPIPVSRLTEENLAEAIRAMDGRDIQLRAGAIGNQIRKEDGVARAVEIIHRQLEGASRALRHQHAH